MEVLPVAGLRFGPAGVPHSSKKPSTVDGIRRCRELGLGCMEMEFVQRVSMGEETAKEVAGVAAAEDVILSSHAPYYVNLNSPEEQKVIDSVKRIMLAGRITGLCGGTGTVFHAAFYQTETAENVYAKVKSHLQAMSASLREQGLKVTLRPETTGKASQFGTVEELLRLSTEVPGVLPCVDFSHLHARSGGAYNSYDEFITILQQIEAALGRAGLESMHIHVSGIEYTDKGERKHLNLQESDLKYVELMRALKDMKAAGTLVCESPSIEEDALLLQETYARL
jgi:deoxyribonuclease-4